MAKGKVINIVLVVAVIVLLTILACYVRIKPTPDNVVVLRTAGITCGGCSGDIVKMLQTKKGIAAVEVDVAGGWVIVGFDSKKIIPETVASTVTGAGFRSYIAEVLSIERFRTITGRNPGEGIKGKSGCGGGCGAGK